MRLDKYTLKGQEAIESAVAMAERLQHQQVEPEHLLATLLEQPEGVTRPMLGKIGANTQAVLAEVEAALKKLPQVSGASQRYFSPRTNDVFNKSQKEADGFKDEYVSTEHLLLAMAAEKSGEAGRILRSHGVSREALLKAIEGMRAGARITTQNAEESYPALAK